MKTKLYHPAIFVAYMMVSISCFASTVIDFRKPENGSYLNSGIIVSIAQDKDGFLWVATRGELAKFDGYSYLPINREANDSLFDNNNMIQKIHCFENRLLYICSNNGLFLFDTDSQKLTAIPPFNNLRVNAMMQVTPFFYLVNCTKGLFAYHSPNGKVKELFCFNKDAEHYPFTPVTSFAADNAGNLWINANNLILHLSHPSGYLHQAALDKASLEDASVDTLLSYTRPHQLLIDKFNTLWWWDRKRLRHAQIEGGRIGETTISVTETSALEQQGNDIIYCDRGKGNFILLRDSSGSIYDKQNIPIKDQFDDLSNTSNVFFTDNRKNTWIGTRDGLFVLPHEKNNMFRNYKNDVSEKSGLNHNTVSEVYLIDNKRLWVGTANGLNYLLLNSATGEVEECIDYKDLRKESNPLDGNKVQSIEIDKDGIIWVGTKDNLKFFNPTTKRYIDKPTISQLTAKHTFVRSLYKDQENNIWIGYEVGGVYKYEARTDTMVKVPLLFNGNPIEECTTISGNSYGEIWVGTRNFGLYRMMPDKSFKHYDLSESGEGKNPSANYITYIYSDPTHITWIGTSQGLFRYDIEKDSFTEVPVSTPTESNRYISGIIADNRGCLWVATLSGINKYYLADRKTLFFPLQDKNLTRYSFRFKMDKSPDGTIFMTGINGLTYFNPKNISSDTTRYRLFFTDFKIKSQPYHLTPYSEGRDINHTDRLHLKYTDNQITFSFSSLTYKLVDNLHYGYKLAGMDKEWNLAGSENQNITYNNLPSGEYTLRLRYLNSSGEWQEEERALYIKIHAPYWAAWYSLLLYAAILGVVLFLIVRETRRREEMKTRRAINNLRIKFFTNLTYSIKTPLLLLKNSIQNIQTNYEGLDDQQIISLLNEADNNSQQLLLLIDQLAEIRRLDQKKVPLRIEEADIVGFSRNIYRLFAERFKATDIHLSFNSNVDAKMLLFDKVKIEIVLLNLLSNALKFSERGGSVEIICHYISSDKKFWIVVKDSGIGIRENHIHHIFEQFWSENPFEIGKASGAGIGLSIAKEYIELHHGEIFVESKKGEGSVFKFYLKRGASHFTAEQLRQLSNPQPKSQLNNYLETITRGIVQPRKKPAILYLPSSENNESEVRQSLSAEYCLIEAASADNLLELFQEHPIQLVLGHITENNSTDQLNTCQTIRNNSLTNHIPYLILIDSLDETIKGKVYESGAEAIQGNMQGHLDELLSRINNMIHFNEIVRKKLRKELIATPKNLIISSADDKFLAKAVEIIEKNLSNEQFSVKDFADSMNLSPSMLYRRMKSITGLSPNDFIKDRRLAESARLLLSKAYNVAEVSMHVGFSDARYFSVCFKKKFGVPPTSYSEEGKQP